MKILITGADGFIGSHLADTLSEKGMDLYGIVHDKKIKNLAHLKGKIKLFACDINDKKAVTKIIEEVKPDYIFHLAAQSFVIPSWKDPDKTLKTNIMGTLNVLDAVRTAKIDTVIVVACSSAEYGLNYRDEIPIKETKEFRPSSPYAVSKVGTDMISYLYWLAYGMKIVRARIFNTIGPRKKGSAVADFGMMIADAEQTGKRSISVGSLNSIVDFTDVRDNVRALWLLATKGKHGEAYNICTGKGHKIGDVLEKMLSLSETTLEVTTDKKKLRPREDPIFVGDNTKLTRLGWKPSIPIEKTLSDTLEYWRNAVKKEKK